jgi:basic membrane protein A
MDIPSVTNFLIGFEKGAKEVNSEIEVLSQYANSFTDAAKGRAIAQQMIQQNADIIFTAGGDVGTGAIEAAKEKGKYAIGVDRDQNYLAPDNVITSAIKRVDVGIYETVKSLVEGSFEGGTSKVYGLDKNGVGIAETTSKNVDQEIVDFVNGEAEKFKTGELKAPSTKAEYEAMFK